MLGLGLLVWEPVPVGLVHDDGVYVLVGRALAGGEGLAYGGVPGTPPASKFPPVYPAFVATLWTVLPEFPASIVGLELVNLVLLAGAAALFTRFQIVDLLAHPGVASAVTVLGFASIELWRIAVVPLSEPLFVLLLVGGLSLATRLERKPSPSVVDWASAVGMLWLVLHTRTAGAVLVGGAVLALLVRRRVRHGVILAAVSSVLAMPWILWARSAAARIPEALRDVLGPYGPWLGQQVTSDPLGALQGLPGEAASLSAHLVTALLPGLAPPVRVVAVLSALPLFALGARTVWTRSRTAVLVTALYLVLVWVWPFKDFRLIAPAFPLLALLYGVGAATLWTSTRPAPLRRTGLAFAVLWTGWFALRTAVGLASGAHLEGLGDRSRLLAEAVAAIDEATELEDVVGAPDLWAGLALYTGRRAAPSARFRPLASPGPPWGTPDQQLAAWHDAGITVLLTEHGGRVHGESLAELTRRCGPSAVVPLRHLPGGARLVRLAELPPCAPGG